MADRLLFRSGGVTVQMDDIGSELVQRAIDHVAPGIRAAIERKVELVRAKAEAAWPVGRTDPRYLARHPEKRGRPHSRDMFRSEIVVQESGYRRYEVIGRIWNDADYWRFIRANKLRGGSPLVAYVRRPLEAARDEIRDELPHLLPEGLSRG